MTARLVDGRRRPWVEIDKRVLERHGRAIGPHGLAVYLAIAWHVDTSTDAGFPSQERITQLTGVSVRQVRRELLRLESFGLLQREPRYRPDGGRTSDLVTLLDMPEAVTPSATQTAPPVTQSGGDRTASPGPPVTQSGEQESVNDHQSNEEDSHESSESENAKRARRLGDWSPTEELITWAMESLHATRALVDYETVKFFDYFRGSGGRKLDWPATWRNWQRRAAEQRSARRPGPGPSVLSQPPARPRRLSPEEIRNL